MSTAFKHNAEDFAAALERSAYDDDVMYICFLSNYQHAEKAKKDNGNHSDGYGPSVKQQGCGTAYAPEDSPFYEVLKNIQIIGYDRDVDEKDRVVTEKKKWEDAIGAANAAVTEAEVSGDLWALKTAQKAKAKSEAKALKLAEIEAANDAIAAADDAIERARQSGDASELQAAEKAKKEASDNTTLGRGSRFKFTWENRKWIERLPYLTICVALPLWCPAMIAEGCIPAFGEWYFSD